MSRAARLATPEEIAAGAPHDAARTDFKIRVLERLQDYESELAARGHDLHDAAYVVARSLPRDEPAAVAVARRSVVLRHGWTPRYYEIARRDGHYEIQLIHDWDAAALALEVVW